MHWFVINPYDGEIEFDCPDDENGEARVVEYLTDGTARFKEGGCEATRMIVIRGDRYDLVPPKGQATLLKRKGPMGL